MSSRSLFGAIVAAAVTAASPAWAGGIYLKISADDAEAMAGQPIRLTLSAVVTRSVTLPAQPQLVVDGKQSADGLQVKPVDGTADLKLSPDRGSKATYELAFAEPGTYKFKLRYRVGNDVVETNKFTVKVGGGAAAAAGR